MTAALIIILVLAFLLVIFLVSAIKVAREYERGIIFRLGRLLAEPKGPGLFILIPIVDRMVRVDLRTITLNIPPQEVITKDNVPVRVNAVAYFRIVAPKDAIVQIETLIPQGEVASSMIPCRIALIFSRSASNSSSWCWPSTERSVVCAI
jgi:regulator of protease activity HflC (stomatin/prohibitin superfamily)